jgi:hypothetical protein
MSLSQESLHRELAAIKRLKAERYWLQALCSNYDTVFVLCLLCDYLPELQKYQEALQRKRELV